MMEHWLAYATYDDGTEIRKEFPYNENGNYSKECDRQYALEAWLINAHEGCNFYSVSYEN